MRIEPGVGSVSTALQEREGYVVEVGEADFVARLIDLTAGADHEEEEAVIPIAELSDDAAGKMREGSVFRWVIGYERSPAGTKKRVFQIVFRDLPTMTEADLRAGTASAFKLPHHGSANADEPGIRERMLEPAPVAVLTPWRRGGRSLPSRHDVTRILARTENAYATTGTDSAGHARKRVKTVDRTIRESDIRLRNLAVPSGIVRLRRPLGPQAQWRVRTFGSACHLQEFFS